MDSGQKAALFKRLLKRIQTLILKEIQRHQPAINSASEMKQKYMQKRWGKELEDFGGLSNMKGDFVLEDPIWLAHKLATILESLDIGYYVRGSVASSLQGEMRYMQDLDLVINLQLSHIEPLLAALSGEFYISRVAIEDAIYQRVSFFNAIHLETTEKADFFIMGADKFS